MKLVVGQHGKLISAVRASFTSEEVDYVLLDRFNKAYKDIAADKLNDRDRSLKLVQYFDMRNEAEMLVAALRDARPRVVEFAELAEAFGLIELPDQPALQALTRPAQGGTIGHDPGDFRAKLAACEYAVCCIWVGGKRNGTGFLVGKDLVLTNHHVVAGAMQADGSLVVKVECEFDYRMAASGYTTPARRVAATAVMASSDHAPEDLDPTKENLSTDLLDYALLRLGENVADNPVVNGGEPRGHIRIAAEPAMPVLGGALVLQHPEVKPMRLDLGAIVWLGTTRIRHNASTLGGSSGSPVFDGDLAVTALHHAGYDWPDKDHAVNQAIPIALIARHIRDLGIAI